METTNKLTKLSEENGIFKGGFASLTTEQLSKLKGGSGVTNNGVCLNKC
ncbi:hypothetical protein [Microbacter margulisiae]|uniref:Uncharacterized protein n=1 Tax=Microbacter margulisiae TaxID=1350067 RepID=A0A7W5DSY3_9PORP|nr:hypothetical protein [Microbacter margulisiae]MBB3188341.1 hypothetical protein [Microbacter margulisiae]